MLPPSQEREHMQDTLLTKSLSLRETVWPGCPVCETRLEVLRIVTGRPGFEHRTLRCRKCGLISEAQAPEDPITSEALGWLLRERRPR